MKKLLSMLLALTVAATGIFPALTVVCAVSSADDYGTNVTATVAAPSTRPLKVDISWTSMEFTYTDGQWNSEIHSYDAGSWSTSGGEITAKNNSIVAINADFAYTPIVNGITGAFTYDTLSLSVGESGSTALSLSGKPAQAMSNTSIGTVTVTITEAQEQNP